MKAKSSARVLVASDAISEAADVSEMLGNHFEHVKASTNAEAAEQEFKSFLPDVLVLAFRELERAQRYYLGLYRSGQRIGEHPHRTVVLCGKEDAPSVFELCKKQYFDDYVVYWPQPQDGLRLPMSVWNVHRELMTVRADTPRRADMASHAKHLGQLENTLTDGFIAGEAQIVSAQNTLTMLEQEIAAANEEFSHRLVRGSSSGAIEVKDSAALSSEIQRLTSQQVERTRSARSRGLEPMSTWAREFRENIEPSLYGTRVLADHMRTIRPLLLAVDDDEFARNLLGLALDHAAFELVVANDAVGALRELRRRRPDVILMDIGLPGTDGLSLTRQIKSIPQLAQIPVIMITGDSRQETLMASMDAGAVDFLVKPFTRNSLASKLDKVLSRSALQ